jgi:site-specific DNA recombinase
VRIATYTRISTDEDHQPYSLSAQAARLGAYITSQPGWELAREFTDQMSGATLERPGLESALREAKAKRFDLLLVYRVDRLSRSVRGLAQILEELDHAGIAFRSATEPFDTATPGGRMFVQMLGVFAEFERATIVERVIAGMERKAATGAWPGGYRPFGYEPDQTSGFLVVKEDEAALVPAMFDWYVSERLGSQAIANRLNKSGHRTKSGKRWNHPAVLTVLANRVYVGEIYYRGAYHPAPHPRLVDTKLFSTAQRILKQRGEDISLRRSNSSDYLLTGLVFCQRCGKRFVGASARGNKYEYLYYVCYTRHRYGPDACDQERLPAPELEDKIVHRLAAFLEDREILQDALDRWLQTSVDERPRLQKELGAIERKRKQAAQALDRYFAAFEAGTLKQSSCATRIESLAAELAQLTERRNKLSAEVNEESIQLPDTSELGQLRAEALASLAHGPLPQRKAVMQSLIAEIRVQGRDCVTPVFRLPVFAPPEGLVGAVGIEPTTSCL